MSIWVIQQKFTPEEEAAVRQRTHLLLPFEGLPDLTMVKSRVQAMQLLKVLHPDEPPESLSRRLDRFWSQYHGLNAEDVVAVPLPASQKMALAQVTGAYEYAVGPEGGDIHRVPVEWYGVDIPFQKLIRHKELFQSGIPMFEVTEAEARMALHGKLPYSYNRFNKWRWLLVLFFVLGMARMVLR
jgi:predicted Mrr-cat superfamily restriction endonuclease